MPAIFHVDQARTFKAVMFMSVSAKTVFGNNQKQDVTKDGLTLREIAEDTTEDAVRAATGAELHVRGVLGRF